MFSSLFSPGFDINKIKAGEVVGWRSELEETAAAAGDGWKVTSTANLPLLVAICRSVVDRLLVVAAI